MTVNSSTLPISNSPHENESFDVWGCVAQKMNFWSEFSCTWLLGFLSGIICAVVMFSLCFFMFCCLCYPCPCQRKRKKDDTDCVRSYSLVNMQETSASVISPPLESHYFHPPSYSKCYSIPRVIIPDSKLDDPVEGTKDYSEPCLSTFATSSEPHQQPFSYHIPPENAYNNPKRQRLSSRRLRRETKQQVSSHSTLPDVASHSRNQQKRHSFSENPVYFSGWRQDLRPRSPYGQVQSEYHVPDVSFTKESNCGGENAAKEFSDQSVTINFQPDHTQINEKNGDNDHYDAENELPKSEKRADIFRRNISSRTPYGVHYS